MRYRKEAKYEGNICYEDCKGGRRGFFLYENQPVLIPELPGKISFKKKNDSEYVQYLIERTYDPVRKHTLPERKIIGIRIPSLPGMMLPNENYRIYIEGEKNMNEEQKQTAENYAADRKNFFMLRDLFEQMYFEFQFQARRKPDDILNSYKAVKINSILKPLRELMAGEEYAAYLDLADTGQSGETDDAETPAGKTYSDVVLLLTQYKGAMRRYNNEKM